MLSDITIRDAVASEVVALEELQSRASLVAEGYRADLLANPDAIQLPLQMVIDRRVRVAVREDRLLGFSVCLPLGETTLELDGLFVEPDEMRRGIGTALIDDIVTSARASGIRTLSVIANPTATAFYERNGFIAGDTTVTQFGPASWMHRAVEGRR